LIIGKDVKYVGIGDWGLGIGDLGVGPKPQTPNPKPPTPNPQSPIPIPKDNKYFNILNKNYNKILIV
jgi:hypothetical protein